jgi:tetratricopeptide (TPR) repeat protein
MTRSDDAKRILEQANSALERKDHKREVELCDTLLAEYSDLINVPDIQSSRAAALCKTGRFAEAEPVFKQLLESHRQFGLSVASTRAMYWWLICYYKGDERKAMDQFVALDEPKALALLNQ